MEIRLDHNAPEIAAAIAASPDHVLPRVSAALLRGALEISVEAKRRAPKFRSTLANSIGIVTKPLETRIVAGARYGAAVEYGSKPGGRPTLKETMDWIASKRIQPQTPGMSVRSLAHLIRHKIATKGITANPFFFASLDAKRSRLVELLQGAARDGLADAATAANGAAGRV